MKISKKSWHYRLISFFYTKPERNLCAYIQELLISFLMLFCLLFISVAAVIGLGFGIGYATLYFIGISDIAIWKSILVSVVESLILVGSITLYEKRKVKKLLEEIEGKEPKESLVLNYIKAKKEKICPLIEFKD